MAEPPVNEGGGRRLTRSQSMIWTGQQLQPGEPLYNMVMLFRIAGPVSVGAFRSAFRALVERCDALRLTITSSGTAPRQFFDAGIFSDTEFLDLSERADPETELEGWIEDRARRPFDLGRCLYDSVLLRLGAEDYRWYFNQHHVATDAWSTALIFRALSDFYALAVAGDLEQAEALPEFQAYVAYEAKQRDTRMAARADAYWRQQLAEPIARSAFYREHVKPRSGASVRLPCVLGDDLSLGIRELASRPAYRALSQDLAEFNIFATVLSAWLHRLTGNDRLAIGTPNHNRVAATHQKTPGLFMEMYPLIVDVDEAESFASLHSKVARAMTGLLMHTLPGGSGPAQVGAYDVLLNYLTTSFGDFAGLPARAEWIHSGSGDRNQLVQVQVEQFRRGEEFRVYFELNAETFTAEERTRTPPQFRRLLKAFLADPAALIGRVDITGSGERESLQNILAGPVTTAGSEHRVIDRFVAQAASTPAATAVRCGQQLIAYSDLAARVETLATGLLAAGVVPGGRVAVVLPRSLQHIVAILAVLRSGAAYVPVDPAYPRERIEAMLTDAAVTLAVVSSTGAGIVPDDLRTVDVDAVSAPPSGPVPRALPAAADLAYVLFTSGSSGRPKGVEVSNTGLANYVDWAARYYADSQPLSWPLYSAMTFDLTVTSLFVPLVTGGQIVVYPETADRREITIRRVVADDLVDVIKLTPTHLRLIADLDFRDTRIRTLIVGGENLKSTLAASVSEFFEGRVAIFNEYGPTEATVACMIHRFDVDRDRGLWVPIGRPIDNARIRVLSHELGLQPQGIVGELCIGGPGLAHGYSANPELTAERFVPDPFDPGGTIYRSGDLARVNPDGTVTCLGRVDDQLKINGVRIEPGEIEAAILAHPAIDDCAVALAPAEDTAGQPAGVLVAYYVADCEVPAEELATRLTRLLPRDFLASRYLRLDRLPLTTSGKLDRRALPVPDDSARVTNAGTFVAPEGRREEAMAGIWRDVLGVGRVSATDDFFALGGDSILAIQLVAAASRQGFALSPQQVFDHPTVRELCRVAETGAQPLGSSEPVVGDAPLLPAQQRFFRSGPKQPARYCQYVLLRSAEPLEPAALRRALTAIIDEHDALRARFFGAGGPWRQSVAAPGDPSLRVPEVRSVSAPRGRLDDITADEVRRALDRLRLDEAPLIRATLIDDDADAGTLLLLVAHHLIVDAVSWWILVDDLERAYRSAQSGIAFEPAPRTLSIRDRARQLEAFATSGRARESLSRWQRPVDAAPPLPLDADPAGDNRLEATASLAVRLGPKDTAKLFADAVTAARIRPQDLLVCSLVSCLCDWSGQREQALDLEGHGREALIDGSDLHRTIGWFTAVYPVRFDCEPGMTALEQLRTVRSLLQKVPSGGIAHDAAHYFGGGTATGAIRESGQPEVLFNFLGKWRRRSGSDSLLTFERPVGAMLDMPGPRHYTFEVNAVVADGQLEISWTYCRHLHQRSTVERLAGDQLVRLTRLLQCCISGSADRLRLTGLPPSELALSELDEILEEFGEA